MNPLQIPSDPFGLTKALIKANEYWMLNGFELAGMVQKFFSNLQSAGSDELVSLLAEGGSWNGSNGDLEAAFLKLIRRYAKLMQKFHSSCGTWMKEYVDKADGLSEKEKQCYSFWAGQVTNAISPANCFWTNPSAVQKFLNSKGKSLLNGYENWADDFHRGDNLVNIADTTAFKIGQNIATTPGFVVFRNKMMEVIQYSPRTESTFSVPIVFIQPWINKFYIFDLTEEKSFVSYLIDQGFTVFITSWKNPSPEMRDVTFDDYMLRGALRAVEVAKEICGVDQVHAAGYCIGGTLLTSLMAWLNRESSHIEPFPIRDFTLFASLIDYSSPGELGVFVNEDSVTMIDQLVKKTGYLDKKYLAMAFRLLRSNDLIWRYYTHNYLQGEVPPKSEFLFWNSDSTRLPAKMCSFYLREFYLKNKLVQEDEMVLANRPIDLRRIEQPLYVVGAEQDHICPWTETFKVCKMVGGPVKYVLSTEGHITGIVNPPSKRSKRKFWTSEVTEPLDADEWLTGRENETGSWWPDWVKWLSEGETMREPPSMGSKRYSPLEKAPGSYVKEQ